MSDLMYPVEIINLPSEGKYYPEGHPLRKTSGQLELKYMTAKEEDILTSTNLIANGTVIDRLLESLIVHEGVKPVDLTTGDVNAVLLAARVLAYGKNYDVQFQCEECEESVAVSVDLTQLESPDDLVDVDEDGQHQFTTDSGLDIVIKTLSRGDELTVEKDNKIVETKYSKKVSSEITSRLRKVIVSINGETDKNVLNTMIDNLIVKDSRKVREELGKINPTVDMMIEFTCDSCGHTMKGGMPIGVDFFWPDIEI